MKKVLFLVISVALFTSSWATEQERIGRVEQLTGAAHILHNFKKTPVEKGEELKAVDYLYTGPESSIQLRLKDGTVVSLGESSCLKLSELFPGIGKKTASVQLLNGSVRAMVKPRKEEASFSVKTPVAVVGVRGTDFHVRHNSDRLGPSRTTVSVLKGVVTLAPNITRRMRDADVPRTQVTLQKFQQSSVQAAEAPSSPRMMQAQEIRSLVAETPINTTASAPAKTGEGAGAEKIAAATADQAGKEKEKAEGETPKVGTEAAEDKAVTEAAEDKAVTEAAGDKAGAEAADMGDVFDLETELPAENTGALPAGGGVVAPGAAPEGGASGIPGIEAADLPLMPAEQAMKAVQQTVQDKISASQQTVQERTMEMIQETQRTEVRRRRIGHNPVEPPPSKE